MGCGMACSCRGGMKSSPRTRTVTPQQLSARRAGLGTTTPIAAAPTSVAPLAMTGTAPQTAAGMTADRRAAEKLRRDTLRNKLGR